MHFTLRPIYQKLIWKIWAVFLLYSICIPPGTALAAENRDLASCLRLSFAPLVDTIPACDRTIRNGRLGNRALAAALRARARASDFAITYHFGHKVDARDLLQAQLGDLDRAVGIFRGLTREIRRSGKPTDAHVAALIGVLAQRAEVERRLGQLRRAIADYSEAIDLRNPAALLLFMGRSLVHEQFGEFQLAIRDMTALLQLYPKDSNRANHLVRRAELFEKHGKLASAGDDYRAALIFSPSHIVAVKAMERLQNSK